MDFGYTSSPVSPAASASWPARSPGSTGCRCYGGSGGGCRTTWSRRRSCSPVPAGAVGLLDPAGDDYAAAFVATLLLRWLAAALLLVFVLTVERQPLASVGIGPVRWKDVHRTVLVAGLAMTVSFSLYLLVQGGQTDQSTQTAHILSSLSFAQLVHLIINAAVVEELFFRGFLIERTSTATGRPWLGALVSYVVFVGSHIPGSGLVASLTLNAVGSLAIVGLYLWRRNVILCIIAHALSNAPILLSATQ